MDDDLPTPMPVAKAILWGGTLVGVLDIAAAITLWAARGVAPVRILQGIASGLLGPEAFRGGAFTAALGLALHFVIAFAVAAVYYAASRSWPVLVRHAVPCGMAYGVLVHLVMDTVVLPLSRGTFRRPPWPVAVAMVAIHVLFVGLPAALAVRRHAPAAGTPPRVDETAAARAR
jgi:hypothetical protein